MSAERQLIESELAKESRMAARQVLLKRLWKLDQTLQHLDNGDTPADLLTPGQISRRREVAQRRVSAAKSV
ncbi:MAG: hypothetical protein QGG36_20345 [Pirellulaceae bacterium]|jgi:hypothetical protein|nr:hypothetical protein [Pirellulaceae bacterium]MDP7018166.1 hypothetical protein [Pirellulaceae bacterium]